MFLASKLVNNCQMCRKSTTDNSSIRECIPCDFCNSLRYLNYDLIGWYNLSEILLKIKKKYCKPCFDKLNYYFQGIGAASAGQLTNVSCSFNIKGVF